MNSVCLIGRLTRDAEMKYTNGGMAIAEFSLAVDDRVKRGEGWEKIAYFFDCTLFGRQAEALQQYLVRGKQVGISGKLRQERWQSQEGQNRSKVVIIVQELDLLGGDRGRSSSGSSSRGSAGSSRAGAGDSGATDEFHDEFPDNIPF